MTLWLQSNENGFTTYIRIESHAFTPQSPLSAQGSVKTIELSLYETTIKIAK